MSVLPAEYRRYESTVHPELAQYAVFSWTPEPAPLLARMHGWHGEVKAHHTDNVESTFAGVFNTVQPEMRGRGDAQGKPDANGWELQDVVDALAAHQHYYPDSAIPHQAPLLWGGSGGGGNVLGLLGKFPDLFAAAAYECGISDYGLWSGHDRKGEFRDELDDAGWIGGSPATNPEAYLSRGGRTTARNLLTPLVMVHGMVDARVPYEQTLAYVDAARAHGTDGLIEVVPLPGVGNPGHYSGITKELEARRREAISRHLARHRSTPELPRKGSLVVAGYLRTRAFSVVLESVDHVARLDYDLTEGTFELMAPTSQTATITLADGSEAEVNCGEISLEDLAAWLEVPITWELWE